MAPMTRAAANPPAQERAGMTMAPSLLVLGQDVSECAHGLVNLVH
jgi:hypothetical protein